jgi:hypothetical protein
VINPNFVFLAMALSVFGGYGYIRDTLKGETSPNRVTWSLWGIEGVLTFGVEVQQHVGLAAWMTLMLGLVPIAVVVASFHNSHAVWKIGTFEHHLRVVLRRGSHPVGVRARAHGRARRLRLRRSTRGTAHLS